ncbi:hypothetical protein BVC80_1837g425 [Macleaya cordata]|uniref:Prefoldin n=1 Tax=Macleaya cordata TaxID=56857 RepID=A0A200R4F4_MACCD|nr:hypothetical protein BVC80_1837g425 [Macleaya cordata]
MSESPEKHTSDQNLEDSNSSVVGNGGFDGKEKQDELTERSPESSPTPDLGFSSEGGISGADSGGNLLVSSTEEEADGSLSGTRQESPTINGETESTVKDEVMVEHVAPEYGGGSVMETQHTTIDDHQVDRDNGVLIHTDVLVHDNPYNGNQTEDAGKEDMFVDASDELVVDKKNIDIEEPVAIIETQESLEEKPDLRESHFQAMEDGRQTHEPIDELLQLRAMLDKTAAEKETMAQEYKVERDTFARELATLHQQLEAMTSQHLSLTENGEGIVDIHQAEKGDGTVKTHDSGTPLQVMISDCSKFTTCLESVLDEKLQSVGTMRQLQTALFQKDREIEDLSAKVTELSVSNNVVVSYLESLQKTWSENLKESSEVHHERDLHLEVVSKRLLVSLAAAVNQEDLLDDSVTEKLSLVEKGTSLMIENYKKFLSATDRLRQCLAEVRSDFMTPEEKEFGIVFDVACEELLECKRKEVDFVEKLNRLEVENKKLLEQLDEEKERLEVVNAEASKTKAELEQEKIRSATVKEKLSMAVTKGKALVQQRDSLKQSLAEKTNELEGYLHKLQEKSNSLEAAELTAEELVRCQNLAASLQESLSLRESILREIEEILPENMLEKLQSTDLTDRVRWLVEQKNVLENISSEFYKLKDVLSTTDLPETILSSSLESQINWLGESFSQAKVDIMKLQGEVAGAWVSVGLHESELAEARNEIELLSASLSAEKEEKSTLQMALDDLSCKYEAAAEKEHRVSSERDGIIRMFLEASEMDNQGDFDHSDIAMLVEKCIKKIKEQTSAFSEYSHFGTEQFERMQSLLYIWNQELMLCEDILEGEMLERSKLMNLSSELQRVSQEIVALKDENRFLQKDLERSEEKTALVREKLSMAVKKGKGLVQERENLKQSLDEKNKEIENFKLEFQQQESVVAECRDQINKLSSDLERMLTLESDLVATKEQRDQLEQFLLESNNMLQRVVKSVETVAFPVDAVFEEPVEKVKWLVQCFHDFQIGRSHAEKELEAVNQEAISLSSKLEEAYTTIKSLEDELRQAKQDLSLLEEEKKDIQVSKACVEEELEKAKEEAGVQGVKFAEVLANIKSLEDALSFAEKNFSVLAEEKTAAEVEKTCAEKELEKAKAEAGSHASKLAEANQTIKSLEDALSQVEKHVSVLAEEKNDAQVGKNFLENELEKAKNEADFQASKVADAYTTIKLLEDALSRAENDMSVLVNEKKNTEQEIITLNAKLTTSMEELAGTRGSSEGQSVELLGHLNHLEVLMKDGALLSLLTQGFKKKLESLRDMHLLLESTRDRLVEDGSEQLPDRACTKRDQYLANLFPADLENFPNGIMDSSETSVADLDNISSYFTKIAEGFNLKNKLIKDNFEGFSRSMDELVEVLSIELQATMDGVVAMLENMESLKQKVKNLETHNHDQESMIHTLQDDVTMLLSACKEAVEELRLEVEGNDLDLRSNMEVDKLNYSLYSSGREAGGDAVEKRRESFLGTEDVRAAEHLVLAARKVQIQRKQFENIKSASETTIKNLHNELERTTLSFENVIQERDLNRNRASELENDLEELRNYCSTMKLNLDEYHAMEDILREREAELSSLRSTVAVKRQEEDGHLLSESQVKTLIEKINGTEIDFRESALENPESLKADPVKKLFYILDIVVDLQHELEGSYRDKEELQSSLAANVNEIEHLKKEAESVISINQELEKAKSDLAEVTFGLENLIQKLRGDDLVKDQRSISVRDLFPVLEKLVKDLILECENSNTKAQELGAKLHGNQQFVDELQAKVTLLEDSIHNKLPPPDTTQERGIFEGPSLATSSEISEIDSMGPVGRNSTSPPVPSAAHVRSMRKGSSDHLALNIDVESDRLIKHPETDDDKGHVFKSLNTSGLIPKQGKLIADRIDGIWVSGGRVLMSRPRARIGLVAYCLFLHIWLFGTIL